MELAQEARAVLAPPRHGDGTIEEENKIQGVNRARGRASGRDARRVGGSSDWRHGEVWRSSGTRGRRPELPA